MFKLNNFREALSGSGQESADGYLRESAGRGLTSGKCGLKRRGVGFPLEVSLRPAKHTGRSIRTSGAAVNSTSDEFQKYFFRAVPGSVAFPPARVQPEQKRREFFAGAYFGARLKMPSPGLFWGVLFLALFLSQKLLSSLNLCNV